MKKRLRNSPRCGDLHDHNRRLWTNPHAMRVDPEPPLAAAHSGTTTTAGAQASRGHYKLNNCRRFQIHEGARAGRARRGAARRQRVHPLVGAHAGEGARGGAVVLLPSLARPSLRCCGAAHERESGSEDWWALGFCPECRFCSAGNNTHPLIPRDDQA
jgi:hypothetical protein